MAISMSFARTIKELNVQTAYEEPQYIFGERINHIFGDDIKLLVR